MLCLSAASAAGATAAKVRTPIAQGPAAGLGFTGALLVFLRAYRGFGFVVIILGSRLESLRLFARFG